MKVIKKLTLVLGKDLTLDDTPGFFGRILNTCPNCLSKNSLYVNKVLESRQTNTLIYETRCFRCKETFNSKVKDAIEIEDGEEYWLNDHSVNLPKH